MKDKNYIATLIDYNAWANAEIYKTILELPREELIKERPSLLKSILVLLNHLLVVDRIWMAHLQEVDHGIEDLRTILYDNIEELWRARQTMDDEIKAYVAAIEASKLEEEIEYRLLGGNSGRLSRAMILTHLAMHGSYHRGWIADMFGQVPLTPPFMDIPVYERALRKA